MFVIDRSGRTPLYEQVYTYIKSEIETGRLPAGARLLSVRRFAEQNGLSKITVAQAYTQLAAEGYVRPHAKAPYEVLPIHQTSWERPLPDPLPEWPAETEAPRYNLATGAMDPDGFDYSRWKRHVNAVLREPDRLMAYGDEKGERELREAIAQYVRASRGVVADQSQVIIASGTLTLLHMVCSLLLTQRPGRLVIVAHEEGVLASFAGARSDVTIVPWRENLTRTSLSRELGIEVAHIILYATPSHVGQDGIVSIGERHALLAWARQEGAYVLEDDYDSELRYYGKPMPAMQGLDPEGSVIYVGAVSKVLPPSIRISYAVFPRNLLACYEARRRSYRQTASVLEQLTLARYMACGDWQRQIRRLRKWYQEKSQYMVALLRHLFGDTLTVIVPEGGLYIEVLVHSHETPETLLARATAAGCAVRPLGGYRFSLSFSAVPRDTLPEALRALCRAWKGET